VPIITILSDFGTRDSYVAQVKGVILGICPQATLVDICHQVAPQAVAEASFLLAQAAPYFPEGTVHLAVVDPGVGTDRTPIAVRTAATFFVAPDNGLLEGVLAGAAAYEVVALTNQAYWRVKTPSATFHGRDIFAPVAAHLANGVPLTDLGPHLMNITPLPDQGRPSRFGSVLRGHIVHVDRFGNLISNVPGDWLGGETNWVAEISGYYASLHRTYADVVTGALLALVGSHGYLEFAVNGGSAAEIVAAGVGTPIAVRIAG